LKKKIETLIFYLFFGELSQCASVARIFLERNGI